MVTVAVGLGPTVSLAVAGIAVWCCSTVSLTESVEQILGAQSLVVSQIWKEGLVVSQSLRLLVVSQKDKGVEVGRMIAAGGIPAVRC